MPMLSARNPRTGVNDYQFEQTSIADLDATCARLRANQPAWVDLGVEVRIAVLERFLAAIAGRRTEIFDALNIDTGRAYISTLEIDLMTPMVARIAANARAVLKDEPPRPSSIPHITGAGQYVAYGLVGNITPWNFPLLLSFLDTWPALVAGNAVVIKPSEVTPRWVEPVRQALAEVPELNAVLAFAPGAGETGAALIERVDLVCFTGSVRTGRKVAEAAARRFIPAFLELGGKDPAVVLASADLDVAASTVLRASISATGQACQSLERVYVERPIYDAFVEMIVDKAQQVTLNTDDEAGFVGPFIFEPQAEIVHGHLRDAVAKGARILTGGEVISRGGKWMRPTVVVDVDHTMALMTEETFGPVIPIMPFDTLDEGVRLANDTAYGLSASVFAGSFADAEPVARRLNAGAISINDGSLTSMVQDFGHESFAFSGIGPSRYGPGAILRYTRRKLIMDNTLGPSDWTGRLVPVAQRLPA